MSVFLRCVSMTDIDIVLASGSPRRCELLTEIGWKFRIEVSDIKETALAGELPRETALRLAKEKAASVYAKNPSSWVIGADTIVVLNDRVFGKPKDTEESISMITALSGRTHTVITGVALFAPCGRLNTAAEETKVTFRSLTSSEVAAYAACHEGLDKAGAYAIQGYGSLLTERIEGCYFNVVGLPLALLSKMFADMGVPLCEQWRNR